MTTPLGETDPAGWLVGRDEDFRNNRPDNMVRNTFQECTRVNVVRKTDRETGFVAYGRWIGQCHGEIAARYPAW